jgi:hypothetical protein
MPLPQLPAVAFRDRKLTFFDLDSLLGSYLDITERGLRKKELSSYVGITNQLFDFLEYLHSKAQELRENSAKAGPKLSYEMEIVSKSTSLRLVIHARQWHHFLDRLRHYRNKVHGQALRFHALSSSITDQISIDVHQSSKNPLDYGGILLLQGDYKTAWRSFEFVPKEHLHERRPFHRKPYLQAPFLSIDAAVRYVAGNVGEGRFVAIAKNTKDYPLEQTALPLAAAKLESRLTHSLYQ